MDVYTIQAIGPAFTTVATLIAGVILISGYVLDWAPPSPGSLMPLPGPSILVLE